MSATTYCSAERCHFFAGMCAGRVVLLCYLEQSFLEQVFYLDVKGCDWFHGQPLAWPTPESCHSKPVSTNAIASCLVLGFLLSIQAM